MRNPDFVEQLRCRLTELGCPSRYMRRLVQEITDHREDLKQDELATGRSGSEAEAHATAKLGDPHHLAEQQMIMLRRSSWFGRHSLISFLLLPVLTVPLLWLLLLGLDLSIEFALGFGWDQKKLHLAADNPVIFHRLVIAAHWADYVAFGLVTLLFCRLARRAAVSFGWMLTACGICSAYALFIWIQVKPHNFALGISWKRHWIQAAIPLLVGAVIYALNWRKTQESRKKMAA